MTWVHSSYHQKPTNSSTKFKNSIKMQQNQPRLFTPQVSQQQWEYTNQWKNQYIQRSLLIFLTFFQFHRWQVQYMRHTIQHWPSLDKNKEKEEGDDDVAHDFSWAQTKSHQTNHGNLSFRLVLFPLHGNMATKKPCKKARHIFTYTHQSCRLHVYALCYSQCLIIQSFRLQCNYCIFDSKLLPSPTRPFFLLF